MDFDFELEDILDSVKNGRKEDFPDGGQVPDEPAEGKNNDTPETLAPPKAKISERGESNASGEAEIPHEDSLGSSEIEPKDEKTAGNKSKNAKEKKNPLKNIKFSFKPPEFVKTAFKKPQNKKEKASRRKIIIIACAVLAVVAAIIVAVSVANYENGGYIKKYEKKYNITYPAGILKEFCDDYGKDQSFCGTISIKDTKTDGLKVYSKKKKNYALLNKGSSISGDQHIRSISVDDKSKANLESVYKTAKGYLNSTQKITFKTLFGEEEYKVIAAYYINTDPNDDNGYVFPYNLYGNLTAGSFFNYQDSIKNKALYDTGYKLKRKDYILNVSVPSDFMPNFRFVVVCVKNETNKFEKITTATPNDNIYYPQAWYDKNNEKNPYYLARNWYPEIKTGSSGATKKLTADDFD